jgi:hypothetical protein
MFALAMARVGDSAVHQIDDGDDLQRHSFVTAHEGSGVDCKAGRERKWSVSQVYARKAKLPVVPGGAIVRFDPSRAGARFVIDNDAMARGTLWPDIRASGLPRHPHFSCGA